MFPSVVRPAERHCVGLISWATIASPFVAVVDVAQCCRDIAAPVRAGGDQQLRGVACFAAEQSLGASEVDHDTVGINNNAPDTPNNQRL